MAGAAFPILSTVELRTRILTALPSVNGRDTIVRRVGQRSLKQFFGKEYPAVYLMKQNLQSTGPGGSSRPVIRQTYDCYIQIVCVAGKYEDASNDGEEERVALCSGVYGALHGWIPSNADLAFDLTGYADGDPADTVNYGVLRFHTRTLTQRSST